MKKPFNPSFLLKNKHIQTVYSSFFKKVPKHDFEVEKFILSDGDFTECYWYNKPKLGSNKPIVILFHGLTGSYHSSYIQGAMVEFAKVDIGVVLMQFRSCGDELNNLPRSYHSGETEDAKAWIEELHKRYPKASLFAVGYSLGGNMLLKLLAELADDAPFEACISVSAPIQLEVCANRMNRGFSKLYQYHLMKNLKKDLLKKYQLHDMKSILGIDEDEVKKLNTFWEFDEAYTAPIHGFKNAKDYYEKSSARQFLKYIKTPTLIIQALDDPFMTPEIVPDKSELSPSIKLEVSTNGGHVGFVTGNIFKPNYWLKNRIIKNFTLEFGCM